MLAIRLQRTGRSGHSQFRLIAQDSRFSPKRGRVVAYLGSYDPHTKEAKLDAELVAKYLENGAQPSDTAASLLKKEGVKLPAWVSVGEPKQRSTRNPEKRRSTRPAEPAAPEAPAQEAAEAPAEPAVPDAEAPAEAAPEEAPAAEEPAAEASAAAEVPAEEKPAAPAE